MSEKITTPEELDALPDGDVLLRASGRYRHMDGTFTDCWVRPVPAWITGVETPRAWEVLTHGDRMPQSMVLTEDLVFPVTVLYRPDAPAPSAEGRACDHAESLHGRCTRCGMTWEQQAAARQPAPVDAETVRRQALSDALAAVERVASWSAGETTALTNASNAIRALVREAEVSRG